MNIDHLHSAAQRATKRLQQGLTANAGGTGAEVEYASAHDELVKAGHGTPLRKKYRLGR